MKEHKKVAVALTAVIAALTLSGTFAYLQDSSNVVKNTFDPNEVHVDLDETTGNTYKIVPGTSEAKDPKVTVNTTLPAYLFLTVTDETEGAVTWELASGWTLLSGHDNVYYREVSGSDSAQTFKVIKDDKVEYSSAITNETMPKEDVNLAFRIDAIQKSPFNNPSTAYQHLSD